MLYLIRLKGDNMSKVGLVLEGGAMRGLYTAGVLDTFMDNNIEIDGIIGVSAGALFGANYFSNQKGRALRYNKKYCKDKRYISVNSFIKTGNIVNKNFAFYKITNELEPDIGLNIARGRTSIGKPNKDNTGFKKVLISKIILLLVSIVIATIIAKIVGNKLIEALIPSFTPIKKVSKISIFLYKP